MRLFHQNIRKWGRRVFQQMPRGHFLATSREKSSGSTSKKVKVIKTLNWENKALFGAVVRKNKAPHVGRSKGEMSDMSSEIYWLMGKAQKVPEFPKILLEMQNNLPPEPTKAPKIPRSPHMQIPFDGDTLRELVDFPLIFNKDKTPEAPDTKKLPSVGRILQATMPQSSREALMRWKVLKIAELGEEGFRKLNEMHLQQGAQLHKWIEMFFSTGAVPEEAKTEGRWKSVQDFISRVQPKIVEAKIAHPFLKYHGIVDCVSIVDSELHVIEWKKSERAKANIAATFDAPLQLAAYLGAVNANLPAHGLTTPVLRGAVVVVYPDGTPAHVHTLGSSDVRGYWRSWLLRLQEYWVRARDGTFPEPI